MRLLRKGACGVVLAEEEFEPVCVPAGCFVPTFGSSNTVRVFREYGVVAALLLDRGDRPLFPSRKGRFSLAFLGQTRSPLLFATSYIASPLPPHARSFAPGSPSHYSGRALRGECGRLRRGEGRGDHLHGSGSGRPLGCFRRRLQCRQRHRPLMLKTYI